MTRMSKPRFLATCLLAGMLFGGIAAGQAGEALDPARLKAAHDLLAAAGIDKAVDRIIETMAASFKPGPPGSARAAAGAVNDKDYTKFVTLFSEHREAMFDKIAQTYARQFTLPELTAVTLFYQTPAGAKFAATGPAIADGYRQLCIRYGKQVVGEMLARQ